MKKIEEFQAKIQKFNEKNKSTNGEIIYKILPKNLIIEVV